MHAISRFILSCCTKTNRMKVKNDIIDFEFDRTLEHLSFEYLETLRRRSDDMADKVLSIVTEWASESGIIESDTLALIQLYLQDVSTEKGYTFVKESVKTMGYVPGYVDWAQIERGQQFFVEVTTIQNLHSQLVYLSK